jgi:hypothetical protein
MKRYTGMVKLSYRNNYDVPTAKYVMAFNSTREDLISDFLPGTKIRITQVNNKRRY